MIEEETATAEAEGSGEKEQDTEEVPQEEQTAEAEAGKGAGDAVGDGTADRADEGEEQTSAEKTCDEREPRVHTPNLFVLRYTGEGEWEMREALKRPYPKLRNGDVVVVNMKTAKWLMRKGMPFETAEDALAVSDRQAEEVLYEETRDG